MRAGYLLIVVTPLLVGSGGSPAMSASEPRPESGLVGYWSFDADTGKRVVDSSPFRNHGTNNGARYVKGRVGKGLAFDAGNHSVEVPSSKSLAFDGGLSMSAWILPTEEYYTVGSLGTSTGAQVARMKLRSMFLSMCMSALEHTILDSAARVPKNEWVHVATTFDGRQLKTYINGKESSSRDAALKFRVTNAGFSIGRSKDRDRPDYYRGILDEVRLYNRALGGQEIEALSRVASTKD